MSTVIICAILVVICIVGLKSYEKRLTSGCCGASSQKTVKKQKVRDRDLSHYPYRKILKIDGMMCSNCVNHVENSLNSLGGVWARVDLMEETADVYMKEPMDTERLKQAVADAGYRVYKVMEQETLPGQEDGNGIVK